MRAVRWFIVTVREAGYTAIVILLVVLLWVARLEELHGIGTDSTSSRCAGGFC
jgi:hypothetical protein